MDEKELVKRIGGGFSPVGGGLPTITLLSAMVANANSKLTAEEKAVRK